MMFEGRRRSVFGESPTDVRQQLREMRERLEEGLPARDSTLTLHEWLHE